MPQTNRQKLYEMLCLEGQQAGLSWITVLKKRENYRDVFHHFDPNVIALMDDDGVDFIMKNNGIIRHRGKINAIILNARALLAMEAQGEDFVTFIWDFVSNTPQVSHFSHYQQAPTTSATSEALSEALKKRGFRFVGPTICYAFMQACGLLNDHTTTCFCHPDNR